MPDVQCPVNALRLFHRCPYCRHGDGDIRIDLHAAMTWPRRDTSINKVPDQDVVVFQAGIAKAPPCPHLLWLLVDINRAFRGRYVAEKTFTWLDCWFNMNDANGLAADLMFTDAFEDRPHRAENRPSNIPRYFRPSVPYRLRRLEREIPDPHYGDPQRRIECEGWVICTVDKQNFLADLGEAVARLPWPS